MRFPCRKVRTGRKFNPSELADAPPTRLTPHHLCRRPTYLWGVERVCGASRDYLGIQCARLHQHSPNFGPLRSLKQQYAASVSRSPHWSENLDLFLR